MSRSKRIGASESCHLKHHITMAIVLQRLTVDVRIKEENNVDNITWPGL